MINENNWCAPLIFKEITQYSYKLGSRTIFLHRGLVSFMWENSVGCATKTNFKMKTRNSWTVSKIFTALLKYFVRLDRMATSATQDMEIDEFEDEDAIALELSSPLGISFGRTVMVWTTTSWI